MSFPSLETGKTYQQILIPPCRTVNHCHIFNSSIMAIIVGVTYTMQLYREGQFWYFQRDTKEIRCFPMGVGYLILSGPFENLRPKCSERFINSQALFRILRFGVQSTGLWKQCESPYVPAWDFSRSVITRWHIGAHTNGVSWCCAGPDSDVGCGNDAVPVRGTWYLGLCFI